MKALALLSAAIFAAIAMLAFGKPVHAATYNEWKNAYSNLCLDVPNGNFYYGQKVQQYACNGGSNQLWTLISWWDGATSFCSPIGAPNNWCIGRQNIDSNGAKAIVVPLGAVNYERWIAHSRGYFLDTFTSMLDGRCLDDTGWSKSSGTWIQVYDCTGGSNQTWHW
jgi:Ricin-type beta-trefoil lectin domain